MPRLKDAIRPRKSKKITKPGAIHVRETFSDNFCNEMYLNVPTEFIRLNENNKDTFLGIEIDDATSYPVARNIMPHENPKKLCKEYQKAASQERANPHALKSISDPGFEGFDRLALIAKLTLEQKKARSRADTNQRDSSGTSSTGDDSSESSSTAAEIVTQKPERSWITQNTADYSIRFFPTCPELFQLFLGELELIIREDTRSIDEALIEKIYLSMLSKLEIMKHAHTPRESFRQRLEHATRETRNRSLSESDIELFGRIKVENNNNNYIRPNNDCFFASEGLIGVYNRIIELDTEGQAGKFFSHPSACTGVAFDQVWYEHLIGHSTRVPFDDESLRMGAERGIANNIMTLLGYRTTTDDVAATNTVITASTSACGVSSTA